MTAGGRKETSENERRERLRSLKGSVGDQVSGLHSAGNNPSARKWAQLLEVKQKVGRLRRAPGPSGDHVTTRPRARELERDLPARGSGRGVRARPREAAGACTCWSHRPSRARPPSLLPGLPRPALRVSSLVPSLPRRARAATALPAFEPWCRSCLPPEEEVEGAGGARRGGGGGGGKMADFLPSRSVLSVCFPGCVLTSGEAEQQRKSKEIDKCLSREKTYVKRLVKILLLGAGESGKSTFLKQMRIIHGQDFDQRAREEFRPTIYSNVIKGARLGSEPGDRGPGPRPGAAAGAGPGTALVLSVPGGGPGPTGGRAGRGRAPGTGSACPGCPCLRARWGAPLSFLMPMWVARQVLHPPPRRLPCPLQEGSEASRVPRGAG